MSIDHIVPAPDTDDAADIRAAVAALTEADSEDSRIELDGVTLPISASVRDALVQLLTYLGEGQSVALGPVAELLTTSQAAEVLGVSDTYVRRLADSNELHTELRGTHRRFRLADLMAYRERFPRNR
ncbi:MAG: helix-turn-helix domain-containing protein [Rhodococcus sp. (in: high G+C Gram-positive bacteria)]|uniref:helix-turn-helix domain-containing protein n=1 Tax=Rhodococcus sp. TaxID=1831 RepID=UPI003BB05AEC